MAVLQPWLVVNSQSPAFSCHVGVNYPISLSPSSQDLKTFLMASQIGKLSGIQLGWATKQNGLGREWWSWDLPVASSPALQPNTALWENLVHFPQGSSTHSPGPDILGGNGQHSSLYRIPSEHPVLSWVSKVDNECQCFPVITESFRHQNPFMGGMHAYWNSLTFWTYPGVVSSSEIL